MFTLAPPTDDGLLAPVVGSWSIKKHHFLRRYVDAFTTAMKNKRWSGLHYIDLFASAGLEKIKETGSLEWGSALIAAQCPYFTQLHLCELRKTRFSALAARVSRHPQRLKPQLIHGDANTVVHAVTSSLPPGSLSLAFLDPHGLHLNFETLGVLSQRKVDLIIFFPDHLDALRNWKAIYRDNPNSNLDRVLGTSSWRQRLSASAKDMWAQALSDLYVRQIRSLGYTHFDSERISLPNDRFLYKLIFCSASPVGAKIWRGIALNKADGQKMFDFGA
jgi:three-Cys-motif partner protein